MTGIEVFPLLLVDDLRPLGRQQQNRKVFYAIGIYIVRNIDRIAGALLYTA